MRYLWDQICSLSIRKGRITLSKLFRAPGKRRSSKKIGKYICRSEVGQSYPGRQLRSTGSTHRKPSRTGYNTLGSAQTQMSAPALKHFFNVTHKKKISFKTSLGKRQTKTQTRNKSETQARGSTRLPNLLAPTQGGLFDEAASRNAAVCKRVGRQSEHGETRARAANDGGGPLRTGTRHRTCTGWGRGLHPACQSEKVGGSEAGGVGALALPAVRVHLLHLVRPHLGLLGVHLLLLGLHLAPLVAQHHADGPVVFAWV